MYCSSALSGGRPSRGRRLAASLPTLRGGGLFVALMWLLSASCLAAAPPIESIPEDRLLVQWQAITPSSATSPESADELASRVQRNLQQARTSGDPRFLGYAQRALQQWPENAFTPHLRVLRGSLQQSLHRFDAARADLEAVAQSDAPAHLRSQAWLILASMALAQGHYDEARAACQSFGESYPGLIAASCSAQVEARTGKPQTAYQTLKRQTLAYRGQQDAASMAWAEGTLADIAAQLGRAEAEQYWQAVLARNPSDLYTRTQYADWLIQHDRSDEALAITEGYDQVDSLAVLRALTLAKADQSRSELTERLGERFDEAQWRGNLLHKRELARYLLDVEDQPQAAFDYAWANWQDQREPADTRLVLRAAQAAGNTEALQKVNQWLQAHQQHDQRYPEATL